MESLMPYTELDVVGNAGGASIGNVGRWRRIPDVRYMRRGHLSAQDHHRDLTPGKRVIPVVSLFFRIYDQRRAVIR
jgi:hypothetical protein